MVMGTATVVGFPTNVFLCLDAWSFIQLLPDFGMGLWVCKGLLWVVIRGYERVQAGPRRLQPRVQVIVNVQVNGDRGDVIPKRRGFLKTLFC